MSVSNIHHNGLCSHTREEIAAWELVSRGELAVHKDTAKKHFIITGPVTAVTKKADAVAQDVFATFCQHFPASGLEVQLSANRSRFTVALRGAAYDRALACEQAYEEQQSEHTR